MPATARVALPMHLRASHLYEAIVNPPFVADAERPLRHLFQVR
jgi:hypothetical protein